MSLYDGHTLRATYKDITNIIGNIAQDVIWDFKVVTQLVDWAEPIIEITLYEFETKTLNTNLFNTTSNIVSGLTITGGKTWCAVNPMGTFSVPGDATLPVQLTFNSSLGVGTYTTTLQVDGLTGRAPTIIVKLHVIKSVPTPDIEGPFTDSMELVLNWSFLNPLTASTDINDVIQVYKDGLIRGHAAIEKQGNFYFTRITVYGNVEDENGKLDFMIWNADQAQAYSPISITNIKFKANTTRGVSTNPEILLVEDDFFQFIGKIIYVDLEITDINDGKTWLTAFSNLHDALDVANDLDTIWMAAGTFLPSISDRSESYVINKRIGILGGFQNGMTLPSQRIESMETILSGNIGLKTSSEDNSYHVIRSTSPDILLDKLSIVDGNANGPLEDGKGGCFYNTGEVSLINCSMFRGKAQLGGSLIFNNGTLSIDGGTYYSPNGIGISSLLNDASGIITITKTVNITRE